MQHYPPGTRVGGLYEVVAQPKLGGMGIVYPCLDLEECRPVVLKTFRPEYLPDRASRDRFLREGTHWVNLGAHLHIVRCYRVFRTDDAVYLVLEMVAREPGREDASLRAWLMPGVPLPTDEALLFALQIARGMRHAVEAIPGFVHRDLKPENVLVGADRLSDLAVNRVRVTDVGLASVLQEADIGSSGVLTSGEGAISLGRTQLTQGIVGTPLYMAPEQWRGEVVTVATDAYALGCILFEMLAGHRVVTGHCLADVKRAHCRGELRPLPAGLEAEVIEVVARCLTLEAGGRYENWAGVEAGLGAAYQAVTSRSVPVPAGPVALSRGERVARGWSYNDMGASYADMGKAEVARGYFEQARSVGEAEGELSLRGAALCNAGLACARLGDARRALSHLEQSLSIYREIQATCRSEAERVAARRGEGRVLGNLGLAHAQMGDARRAIGYYEQQSAIALETGDRDEEGKALEGLGTAYATLGDVRRAIGYYEQQLVLTREIGDRRGEGSALGNLGGACVLLGDARRAIGFSDQQLIIAREIGDRRGEGSALLNLGAAYFQLGEARRAIDYHTQSLTIHREIGDRRGQGQALGSLAGDYFQLGDVQQAIRYLSQASTVFEEIGDAMNAASIGFNLAITLASQGRFAEAMPHAERAAQVFAEAGQTQYAQKARNLLTRLQAALR
jgi:tetratricopeptide (TPR) repeat protein